MDSTQYLDDGEGTEREREREREERERVKRERRESSVIRDLHLSLAA